LITQLCRYAAFKFGGKLRLKDISNLGASVWPSDGNMSLPKSDSWRLRFVSTKGSVTQDKVTKLLSKFNAASLDVTSTHMLYNYDGKPGYTASQGEKNAPTLG